jgi:hypothetical protein
MQKSGLIGVQISNSFEHLESGQRILDSWDQYSAVNRTLPTTCFKSRPIRISALHCIIVWNRTFEIRTKVSGFQITSEIRTVWEPDDFRKRRNPDVRISDVYCIYVFRNRTSRFRQFTVFRFRYIWILDRKYSLESEYHKVRILALYCS